MSPLIHNVRQSHLSTHTHTHTHTQYTLYCLHYHMKTGKRHICQHVRPWTRSFNICGCISVTCVYLVQRASSAHLSSLWLVQSPLPIMRRVTHYWDDKLWAQSRDSHMCRSHERCLCLHLCVDWLCAALWIQLWLLTWGVLVFSITSQGSASLDINTNYL